MTPAKTVTVISEYDATGKLVSELTTTQVRTDCSVKPWPVGFGKPEQKAGSDDGV